MATTAPVRESAPHFSIIVKQYFLCKENYCFGLCLKRGGWLPELWQFHQRKRFHRTTARGKHEESMRARETRNKMVCMPQNGEPGSLAIIPQRNTTMGNVWLSQRPKQGNTGNGGTCARSVAIPCWCDDTRQKAGVAQMCGFVTRWVRALFIPCCDCSLLFWRHRLQHLNKCLNIIE